MSGYDFNFSLYTHGVKMDAQFTKSRMDYKMHKIESGTLFDINWSHRNLPTMKLLSVHFVFLVALLTNCQEQVQSSEIIKIEFGTSFGMCAGYCTQTVTVMEGEVSKTIIPRMDQNLTEKTCAESFGGFHSLSLKVNQSAFMNLEEIIGCPDCAEGGAEWIEITTASGVKKVTYEYGKEPDAVKSFIGELRELYSQLGECE